MKNQTKNFTTIALLTILALACGSSTDSEQTIIATATSAQSETKIVSTEKTAELPAETDEPTVSYKEGDPIVVENRGQICFEESDSVEVSGHFKPQGCFSSSCTQPIEQFVYVKLDNVQNVIQFETRFVLIDPLAHIENHVCTEDCDGAGRIEFEIGAVDQGVYTIRLGENNLGEINFPPIKITGQDICFGEPW